LPKAVLTDISVRALSPPERGQITYWDEMVSGFGIRISQGGAKSFILVEGPNRQRHTIGRYPTLALKTARNEAKRLKAELTLGLHKPSTISFAEAKELFLDACRQKNKPRTVADYTRILNRHFRFGKMRLGDISRADVQKRLAKLRATPSEQNHAFVAVRIFFNWALREQLIPANPIAGMSAPNRLVSRDRVLSDQELATIFRAARGHPYPFGSIITLLIVTGQRRGEIAALEWDWIDKQDRTIALPGSLTKNSHAHVFPIGELALAVLEAVPQMGPYVFPSRVESGTIFKGWGKCKTRFDAELESVESYTLHDLRRTFASTLAKLGTPIHVTEKLLNHISGTVSGVAAIYNRHSYMDEMREAIAAYKAHLANLTDE
jgi:integrase